MPLEVFCSQRTTLTSGGFSCGTGISYPSLLPRAISSLPKAQRSRRWTMARRSLIVPCLGIFLCQFSIFTLYKCFTKPLLNFLSRNMYIHRELVAKGALTPFFVPAYLQLYVDDPLKCSSIPLSKSRGFGLLILEALVGTLIAEWAIHLQGRRFFSRHSLPLL